MPELKLVMPVASNTQPATPLVPLTSSAGELLATIASLTEMSQFGCDLAEAVFLSLTSRLQESRVIDGENHFLGYNHALAEGGFLMRTGPVIFAVAPASGEGDDVEEHLLFDGLAHKSSDGDLPAVLESVLAELLRVMTAADSLDD